MISKPYHLFTLLWANLCQDISFLLLVVVCLYWKKSFWFLSKDPEMRLWCQITWVYVLKIIFCIPSKYKGTIFFSWHSSAKVGRMAVVQVMCVWEICNIFFYSNSKNYAFRKPFISHLASSNSHKRCFNVGTKLILLSLSQYAALRHIICIGLPTFNQYQ